MGWWLDYSGSNPFICWNYFLEVSFPAQEWYIEFALLPTSAQYVV